MPSLKTKRSGRANLKIGSRSRPQSTAKAARKRRPQARTPDVRVRIHDPYLADAVQDYGRVLANLKSLSDVREVEEDCYLLCELSRDITIRLLPFTQEMGKVISWAVTRFEATLKVLHRKPTNPNIQQYAGNIQKRVAEYKGFLKRS